MIDFDVKLMKKNYIEATSQNPYHSGFYMARQIFAGQQ